MDGHAASGHGAADAGAGLGEERAAELAEVEIRAAIALVAGRPGYRVLLCGMAMTPRLVADFDGFAAGAGVVLERRIREGGGLDVVVRSA